MTKGWFFGDIMIAHTQRHPTHVDDISYKNTTPIPAAHKMRSYTSRLNKRLYIVNAHDASMHHRKIDNNII